MGLSWSHPSIMVYHIVIFFYFYAHSILKKLQSSKKNFQQMNLEFSQLFLNYISLFSDHSISHSSIFLIIIHDHCFPVFVYLIDFPFTLTFASFPLNSLTFWHWSALHIKHPEMHLRLTVFEMVIYWQIWLLWCHPPPWAQSARLICLITYSKSPH